MRIHVSLKEEINLSNLNNQSSLFLSGIIYSFFIHVRYFSFSLDMYLLFIDMGFKTMSNSEKEENKTINEYKIEKSTEWVYESTYQLVVCVITVADFSRTK